jgi:hypothetical protein
MRGDQLGRQWRINHTEKSTSLGAPVFEIEALDLTLLPAPGHSSKSSSFPINLTRTPPFNAQEPP